MAFTDIEELLAAQLGFDVETIGLRAVETMVRRAMEQAGFSDTKAYAWLLKHEPEAWERFVDHVVIPETWFFRDVAPFELAAELIRTRLHPGSNRVIRLLSCPCSTGEEPYSLVLSVLRAGAPRDSFCVDAIDVSRRALEVARVAAFNARSFRSDLPSDYESYFDRREGDGSRQLNVAARACVRFLHGNIIAPDFLRDQAPYDVVFCRNLLIYLRPEARVLAMAALRRLVAENGVLVLGHAETAFARENGFKPTGPSGAFAFAKSGNQPTPKRERNEIRRSLNVVRTPVAKPVIVAAAPSQPISNDEGQLLESGHSPLVTARQLGDAGQLHSALKVCSEYLQNVPDCAEGYFLLALLHDALGHMDLAASSFRKVLYLDPNHHDALLCLALKQEARGDSSGAALLRQRARHARHADDANNV